MIKLGPVYGSKNQFLAAKKIKNTLEEFGWDKVWITDYKAKELSDHPLYVPVKSFGEVFRNDDELLKYNVTALLDSGKPGPTLILNSHYDVEPINDDANWSIAWNSGEISDGRIWGRGASDMLGGLSSQLIVASNFAMLKNEWCGKIIFNAVTDEEIGGNGSLASLIELDRTGLLRDPHNIYCLIAEPSNKIYSNDTLGFMHICLSIKGRGRHVSGSIRNDNAINIAMDLIQDFPQILQDSVSKLGIKVNQLIYNFGIIEGGYDAATPVGLLKLEGSIFYPALVTAKELQNAISSNISKLNPNIGVSFGQFNFEGHSSQNNKLYTAIDETSPSRNIKPGIFDSPCDARLFVGFGIKNTVVYGPGSLEQAHTYDEYIQIAEIDEYNKHIEAAIRQLMCNI